MRCLFVSDLHLSAERPEILGRFLDFLRERAIDAERLYVLGDLFDAWIGDDDEVEPAPTVKAALRDLVEQGIWVGFVHGNRDFLVGEQFARDTGVELLPEVSCVDLSGRNFVLMHGDTLCTDDLTYQEARKQLRNPQFVHGFLAQPLEQRRIIAADYRRRSGEATSLKAADIMDVNAQAVARVMLEQKAEGLIHGHTHRPAMHKMELLDGAETRQVERHVLPDWSEAQGGFLEWNGEQLSSGRC